ARFCAGQVTMQPGDTVLDIGSNDGTLLRAYLELQSAEAGAIMPRDVTFVGMDPTIRKFRRYYPEGVTPIPDFFSAGALLAQLGDADRKARIVTSISCFYD